jgi:MFS family permease
LASINELFSSRRYPFYLVARFSLIIATQMLSVAVGWEVWEITGRPLALGFSGLAVFLPNFLLALAGGQVADRVDRRRVLIVCNGGVILCAATLASLARSGEKSLPPIYAVLATLGAIRAFSNPAGQALMPSLVDKGLLERAVALNSSSWQFALIAGPSLGGVLYAATGKPGVVYEVCGATAFIAMLAVIAIGHRPTDRAAAPTGRGKLTTLFAGIRYVWSTSKILGAISLDLFAVLLGGAVALLPIYASEYLHIGAWGLGLLRSAPAAGAAITALVLAWFPLKRRTGIIMFVCVFVFGVATIVFGLSRYFALSLIALVTLGAADMVSVVIRSTLIQLNTPDDMRGRVATVNSVFIGASNDLGEFESGITAAWLGPELAVLVGGIGTCVVVLVWAGLFPELRKVDRLGED